MTNTDKKIMLSGVQPSNQFTLGNYLGAIKNWVSFQNEYFCLFFAADLHAITVRQDPAALRSQTYQALATYLAAGIDPERAVLFVQSHVSEHAELAWVFNCFAYMGELGRMTQFKDKSSRQGQNVSAGLFAYPALMAADILLYRTHRVPVGDDQKQHLEITRDLAIRMNNAYGEDTFVVPDIFSPPVGARIMSLQNPSSKMSKSDPDPMGAVFLADSDDMILKKLKRAVTDSGTEITYDESKPGIRNLIHIQSALSGKSPIEIVEYYQGKQYGHLKLDTADWVIKTVGPIREKTLQYMSDKGYLDSLFKKGAKEAKELARITLNRVYDRIGFVPARS